MSETQPNGLQRVGWREWVALPGLGINRIKAKIDTGARTSALHAYSLDPFRERGALWLRFRVHPWQSDLKPWVECVAEAVDLRWVRDSGGHRERRYVILTEIELGQERWPIETTLTSRDTMAFRMLLGRTALRGRFAVDPDASYVVGIPPRPPAPGRLDGLREQQ